MLGRKQKNFCHTDLAEHHGFFRRRLSLFEGTALIVSGTVGAGILSIPYAMAQSSVWIGALYIVVLGLLMMGLNLMLGEVAVRTKQSFQLVGLARKYLGRVGEILMVVIMYAMLFGVLVVYIIGEGETLAALFGGASFEWSLIFFVVAACLVAFGMRTVKTAELLLTTGILAIVVLIAAFGSVHINVAHFEQYNLAHVLLPYGVVLFALHGTTAIPETYSVLKHKDTTFKTSIILGSVIVMIIYLVFSFTVVGVTGLNTTEIATIGLGNALGRSMFIFGNVFALFAMATSFLLTGVALRDSLSWDYKLNGHVATALVVSVPLVIFLAGLREFIAAIDIVGGVFGSIEVLLILLIYWRAKQLGDVAPGKYRLHHTLLLGVALAFVFAVGAVYSVWNLF